MPISGKDESCSSSGPMSVPSAKYDTNQPLSPTAPVYGWAMNFTTSSNPYMRQRDIVGGPSSPLLKKPCDILQRDASDVSKPSFYTLGPLPRIICPYYNYILPNAYPYGDYDTACSPNPKQYWYSPYYKAPNFWKNPVVRVPKPG